MQSKDEGRGGGIGLLYIKMLQSQRLDSTLKPSLNKTRQKYISIFRLFGLFITLLIFTHVTITFDRHNFLKWNFSKAK